jgi:hypothetical protein
MRAHPGGGKLEVRVIGRGEKRRGPPQAAPIAKRRERMLLPCVPVVVHLANCDRGGKQPRRKDSGGEPPYNNRGVLGSGDEGRLCDRTRLTFLFASGLCGIRAA